MVVKPFTWLLQVSANAVTRLFGVTPAPAGELAHTEEDIRHIVAGAEDAGVIATTEEEMLYKVFDFADKEVHEVMVPRPQVVAISITMPTEEALAALLESPYTRYPVYRESLDEIAGILHVRDLFSALHDRGIANVDLEELLRPVYIVPETKDLAALLAEFRKQNQHMAVVVDEYGAMQGIVTLEDLLEEIVGEIEDEFDLPDESIERIDDTHIRIDGTFPIDDFNEQFGTELEVEDYHTMAGIVFGELGRAAEVGDEVQINGLVLRVMEVEGSRIQRLEVEFNRPDRGGARARRGLALLGPEGVERRRVARQREHLGDEAVPDREEEQLVDVDRPALALAARAVEPGAALLARERVDEGRAVGAVRQLRQPGEEAEDLGAAAVRPRHDAAAGHVPDGVLGEALPEREALLVRERLHDPAHERGVGGHAHWPAPGGSPAGASRRRATLTVPAPSGRSARRRAAAAPR